MRSFGNSHYVPLINDMHCHARDAGSSIMGRVLPYQVRRCANTQFMPNTTKPILTADDVNTYYESLKKHSGSMQPLVTFKLTAKTKPEDIRNLWGAGVSAGKLYPEGVTTNSSDGISANLIRSPSDQLLSCISEMENKNIALCLHGEMPGESCLDAEAKFLFFIDYLVKIFPKLRIVLEHITTKEAVALVEKYTKITDKVAATITLHHLHLTIDDILGAKLYPHNFCKPIAKRVEDREALRAAALSENPQFFFGSDSAPHERRAKESHECCAGIYSAPVMLEMLVEWFDQHNALPKYEGFCHFFAQKFYNLRKIANTVRVVKQTSRVPFVLDGLVPFYSGKQIGWQI